MAIIESPDQNGIYVAPLQINKDRSSSNDKSPSRLQTSSFVPLSTDMHHLAGQMTPPMTPNESAVSFERHNDFQTYLRAFYPYHPSFEDGSSTITLPLNGGDVILVHSIHTNGWADGTLLASGARGWLPTNYCEGYCNEPISSLLKALTVFWDLVKGSSKGDMTVFRNSEYVRGLVGGVRCLLERTQCLSRECPLVESHMGIRKNRRALLSDLSAFVKVTKALESVLNNSTLDNGKCAIDLDELVLKAFKTVMRAVKFLDVWEEHMQSIITSSHNEIPPTPPADRSDFGDVQSKDNLGSAQRIPRPRSCRASQTLIRPGSSHACRESPKPPSGRESHQLSHRVSAAINAGSQDLASEKLVALHNTFLTYLGYFIGLHIQSRSSSELLLTTKQAVLACRDLLDLVSEIWERDWRRSHALGEARDGMYRTVAELAEAARDIFRPLRRDEDEFLAPSEGKPLMDAATACVRTAGKCVAESRFVIDRIGDFDFPPLGLEVTDEGTDVAPVGAQPLNAVGEEQRNPLTYASSALPPPAKEPPPPPSPFVEHQEFTASNTLVETAPQQTPIGSKPCDRSSWQRASAEMLLPPLPPVTLSLLSPDDPCSSPQLSTGSNDETPSVNGWHVRKDSLGVSSVGDSFGYVGSMRDSETSAISQSSTRATSPDTTFTSIPRNQSFATSFTGSHRCDGETEDIEANLLERTFAHELVYNKEGQITGGTLPALIERLTTPDSTPDSTFVSSFYLTFRLFATPTEFAQALIDRYNYIGDSPRVSAPVRLRVYNVFKGWLESHWRHDCDKPVLDLIQAFATRQLQIVLPTAGKRLASLAEKVTTVDGQLVPRLISSIGKTNTSIAQYIPPDSPMPPPIINKSQLNVLKNWKHGYGTVSILDFDPLELARQLTIKESQIFCSILPEELLASEWTKQSGSMAVNVRAMSRLSTDLANLVADHVLQAEDPKKRAIVIKQWTKIADKLLDLSNYHSLMAIFCSLTQSTIMRLKRTWECVSSKTKLRLEKLKSIINHERNYASLRQTFQNQTPPCVPWVGLYLTDLTFVDAGNQTTRQLPGVGFEGSKSVINFDKHMKTAKIISELQRFQVPYRLIEIAELQTWLQDQLVRVRAADQTEMVKDHYRRSLLLEPRASPETQTSSGKEKFEMFFLGSKIYGANNSPAMHTVM
ncbi:MAG: hypothetical protein Q9217_004943 [Psora testacea]